MIFSFCVFVFSFIFFPILILFGFSFIPLDWWRRIDATHAIESFKTMLLRFKTSFITKSASPVLSATSHWATHPSECIMYDKTLKSFRYCDTIRFLISLSRMFPIVRNTTTSVLESAAMTAERSSRDAKSLLLAKAITRYLLALFHYFSRSISAAGSARSPFPRPASWRRSSSLTMWLRWNPFAEIASLRISLSDAISAARVLAPRYGSTRRVTP